MTRVLTLTATVSSRWPNSASYDNESINVWISKFLFDCLDDCLYFRSYPVMKKFSAIGLAILAAYVSPSPSRADIILSVDLDPATPGIQSNGDFAPGQTITADIVMNLSGNSTLSAYQFSLRFDRNELTFVSRSETAPPGFGFFETDASNGNNLATSSDQGLLYRFGADSGAGPIAPAGPFVVASAVFTARNATGGLGDIDIAPGKFEDGLDDFLANGTFLPIPNSQLVFNGASITPVAAIPEPTSLSLIGMTLLIGASFRRQRSAR
jgi:hypothetical protein